MSRQPRHELALAHKTALTVAGALVSLVPLLFGLIIGTPAARSQSSGEFGPRLTASFDVASIRPSAPSSVGSFIRAEPDGSIRIRGISIRLLIQNAYNLMDFQIIHLPSWADSARYDILAKAENPQRATPAQRKALLEARLRSLLAERFNLSVHESTRQLPTYSLVVWKGGPKLTESSPNSDSSMGLRPGLLTAKSLTMADLAANLSNQLGRTVQDQTGLSGHYDFTLRWTADQMRVFASATNNETVDSKEEEGSPSLVTAIQEQLGLKLQRNKGPVRVLVVDHVERPSSN